MAPPSTHGSVPSQGASLLPKAFRLLDGEHELLLQLLVALVRREVQTIKATEREEGEAR